jgi:hypothetical protein
MGVKEAQSLARYIYAAAEQVRLARDPALAQRRQNAYAARLALEPIWEEKLLTMTQHLFRSWKVHEAIIRAKSSWTLEPAQKGLWRLLKADSGQQATPPPAHEVAQSLAAGFNEEAWAVGAVQVYLGLAYQTSTEAGQHALKALGLDKTFAWAHPQNMARDIFSVRGSKVIQNMYGNHLEALTKIIIQATDPRNPLTIDQVNAKIAEEWPALTRYQVERIARTETASVWTTTSVNAYRANGISKFESIIAHGPSIGTNPETLEIVSEDPCDECTDYAADGPYDIESGDLPPWHPNCRCEAIPVLEDANGDPWLPPAEPWTGGDPLSDPVTEDVLAARSRTSDATERLQVPNVSERAHKDYALKLAALRKKAGLRG